MRKFWILILLPLVQACSDDSFNGLIEQQDVAFDGFLLEMVDPSNTATEPQAVGDKKFIFPEDTSAFAALFP